MYMLKDPLIAKQGTPRAGSPTPLVDEAERGTHRDDVSGFDVEAGEVVVVAVIFDGSHLEGGRGI